MPRYSASSVGASHVAGVLSWNDAVIPFGGNSSKLHGICDSHLQQLPVACHNSKPIWLPRSKLG